MEASLKSVYKLNLKPISIRLNSNILDLTYIASLPNLNSYLSKGVGKLFECIQVDYQLPISKNFKSQKSLSDYQGSSP